MGGFEAQRGFDIGEIPAGTWRLWACTWSDTEGYAVSEPFEIGEGQQFGEFVLIVPRLQATDTIEGHVLDATGKPDRMARVYLMGPTTASIVPCVIEGKETRYLSSVAPTLACKDFRVKFIESSSR